MSRDHEQATTQFSSDGSPPAPGGFSKPSPRTPTLTIIYHPVLRRIGDRVFLSELLEPGRDAKISRNAPPFTPTRQHRGSPLEDTHLSRNPFFVRHAADGGVVIVQGQSRTPILVDGAALADQQSISSAELERGVILELADHIALLLHLHEPVEEQGTGDLGLVGESDCMVAVRENIRRVADLDDVNVLIRGETGTGKELVAQAIHALSARRERQQVSVNLGALPASLAASELFGTARGAFTGANPQKGYFRSAHGSTLFLDEVGEASSDVQAALLRAIETRQVYPLGTQRSEEVDVRILAATDADLENRVENGTFREPLLHRLAGYEIRVPALRERRDDIARLMVYFLGLELTKYGEADRLAQMDPAPWLPMEIVVRFVRCQWRGNVRQLRNAVRSLVIANRGRPVAALSAEIDRILRAADGAPADADISDDGNPLRSPGRHPLPFRSRPAEFSDEEFVEILREHHWEISAAAKAMGGVSRTSMYKRIRQIGLRLVEDIGDDEIRACYDACRGDIEAMVAALQVSRNALMPRLKKLGLV
jgi:DNA-binding NtrC family response regulator